MQYKSLEYKEGIQGRICDLTVGDVFSFTEYGFRYDVHGYDDDRVYFSRYRSVKHGHTGDSRGRKSKQIIIIYKKYFIDP